MAAKRPPSDADLPRLLAWTMEHNGWDQIRLAEVIGVDQGTVSKWVSARSAPTRRPDDNWLRIADAAGITVAEVGSVIGRTTFIKRPTYSQLEKENAELRQRLAEACNS